MKIYIFYYEVLPGQNRTINEPPKKRNEKSPKNIESFPPHPPGGGQHYF
jgi:hypothetical protein